MNTADEYLECVARQKLIMFQADGAKAAIFRCVESQAKTFGEDVTPDVCKACGVRPIILRARVEMGKYKPKKLELKILSKVSDTRNDGWPPCRHRHIVEVPSCCGKTAELKLCDNVDCLHYGAEVHQPACQSCGERTTGYLGQP